MNCVRNFKHVVYLCRDYNIDLLNVKVKEHYCEYYDEIISQGFFPKITLPTRFSDSANTPIDNIFATNKKNKHFRYFVESYIGSPNGVHLC